jgi:uncharacterized protein (DUF1330 family)
MSAYVISEVTVLDEKAADRYRTLAEASIQRYGGRYLVRAGTLTTLEGTWPRDQALMVVEFPSTERAREWYASREYAEALAIRQQALDRRLVLAAGAEGPSEPERRLLDLPPGAGFDRGETRRSVMGQPTHTRARTQEAGGS